MKFPIRTEFNFYKLRFDFKEYFQLMDKKNDDFRTEIKTSLHLYQNSQGYPKMFYEQIIRLST